VTTSSSGRNAFSAIEIVIAICFLVLIAWFLLGSGSVEIPPAVTPAVNDEDLQSIPLRIVQTDEPVTKIGSFTRRCNECHGLFGSPDEHAAHLTQHNHIVLEHGINDRCYNCHDQEDRERLALRGNRSIPFTEVARLCAKCHGPTYRDWQMGMHGKSLGSWDPDSPNQRRLKCSECHDPHAPAYELRPPLPGPNTLRMNKMEDEILHGGEIDHIDPLRKWQIKHETAPVEHPSDVDHENDTDTPAESEAGGDA